MDSTARLTLDKIQADREVPVSDLTTAINANADKLDTAVLRLSGLGAPAGGTASIDGRLYRDTDTNDVYYDTGTAWMLLTDGLVMTSLKSAAYTAAVQDAIPVDLSTANVPITLPTEPTDGSRVQVKVVKVNAVPGTYVCTISCSGSDEIDLAGGATGLTLTTLDQGVTLKYSAAHALWFATADPGQILSCAYSDPGSLTVGTAYQPNLARPTFVTQAVYGSDGGDGDLFVVVGPTKTLDTGAFVPSEVTVTANEIKMCAFIVPAAWWFMFTHHVEGSVPSLWNGPTYVTL